MKRRGILPHAEMQTFDYVIAPPINTDRAERAVYIPRVQLPVKPIAGCGYPVRGQLVTLPGVLMFARQAVTRGSLGMVAGQYALQPTTRPAGQFIDTDYATDAAELEGISAQAG